MTIILKSTLNTLVSELYSLNFIVLTWSYYCIQYVIYIYYNCPIDPHIQALTDLTPLSAVFSSILHPNKRNYCVRTSVIHLSAISRTVCIYCHSHEKSIIDSFSVCYSRCRHLIWAKTNLSFYRGKYWFSSEVSSTKWSSLCIYNKVEKMSHWHNEKQMKLLTGQFVAHSHYINEPE